MRGRIPDVPYCSNLAFSYDFSGFVAILIIIEVKSNYHHFDPKYQVFSPYAYKLSFFFFFFFRLSLPLGIQIKYSIWVFTGLGLNSTDIWFKETIIFHLFFKQTGTGKWPFSLLLRLRWWCFSLLHSLQPISCTRVTSTLCIIPLRLLLLSPSLPLSIWADAQGGEKHLSVSFEA